MCRNNDFVSLIERIAKSRTMTDDDREVLVEYATGDAGIVVDDQLSRSTRTDVEALTGRDDVWSPRLAAKGILETIDV